MPLFASILMVLAMTIIIGAIGIFLACYFAMFFWYFSLRRMVFATQTREEARKYIEQFRFTTNEGLMGFNWVALEQWLFKSSVDEPFKEQQRLGRVRYSRLMGSITNAGRCFIVAAVLLGVGVAFSGLI